MQEIPSEEYLSLRDWSRIILKRWKVILIVFIVVFSAVFSFSFYNSHQKAKRQVPVYTAHIKMMLGPEVLETTGVEGQMIRRMYSFVSEKALLESDIIAQQAAGILKEKHGYKEPKDELAQEVKNITKIDVPDESGIANIIDVDATSTKSTRAFEIVNALVEGYQKQKIEDEKKLIRNTYRTLSEQLDVARENLHKAENTLTDFITENEEIAETVKTYGISGEQVEGAPSLEIGINEKYLMLKSKISTEEDFINSVKELSKNDKIAALGLIAKRSSHLVDIDLKKALLEKEEELNNLLLINEEAHPEVIRARGELNSIKSKIDEGIVGAIKNMEMDLNTLRSQEKKLSGLIESDVHKKIIAYNTLKRDIDIKRKIYHNIADALQNLDVGERLKRYWEIRVLEPAQVPKAPSNPAKVKLSQIILFSLTVAAISCVGLVYTMELFDTSIKDVEQLERLLELPVLVMIPWHRRPKPKKGGRKK